MLSTLGGLDDRLRNVSIGRDAAVADFGADAGVRVFVVFVVGQGEVLDVPGDSEWSVFRGQGDPEVVTLFAVVEGNGLETMRNIFSVMYSPNLAFWTGLLRF